MARTAPFLKDDQWVKLEPLLPKMTPGKKGGRPWRNNRQVLEGILWVLKTGARWRDLPERYASPSTCWRRLKLWEEMDIWLDIWRALLAQLDEQQYLMWEETFADGSFAPAKKGGPRSGKPSGARAQRSWRSQTVMVFLSPPGLRVLRRMRRSSSKRRSTPAFSASHPIVLLETELTTAIRSTSAFAKNEGSS